MSKIKNYNNKNLGPIENKAFSMKNTEFTFVFIKDKPFASKVLDGETHQFQFDEYQFEMEDRMFKGTIKIEDQTWNF